MKRISVSINKRKFVAELNETETARGIYAALPLEAEGNFWGEEIYSMRPDPDLIGIVGRPRQFGGRA